MTNQAEEPRILTDAERLHNGDILHHPIKDTQFRPISKRDLFNEAKRLHKQRAEETVEQSTIIREGNQ